MFGWLKKREFADASRNWQTITGIRLDDQGEITRLARELMQQHRISADDAWLTALATWMYGLGQQHTRLEIARGLMDFLGRNQKTHFERDAIEAALAVAHCVTRGV